VQHKPCHNGPHFSLPPSLKVFPAAYSSPFWESSVAVIRVTLVKSEPMMNHNKHDASGVELEKGRTRLARHRPTVFAGNHSRIYFQDVKLLLPAR